MNCYGCENGIEIPVCGNACISDRLLRRVGVPVGAEMFYPGKSAPELWLDESADHGPLLRADYPDLFDFAINSGNMIDEENWLEKMERNGAVGAFSSGDGVSTFRIPLLRRVYARAADPENGFEVGRYQRASIVAGINDGEVSGAVPGLASHTWSTDPDSVLNLMNLEPFQTNGESLYHHSLSKGPSGAVSRITPVNNENVHSVGAVRPVSVVRLPIIKALLR